MTIKAIEISFGAAVELSEAEERLLMGLLSSACDRYSDEHPDRIMWVAGWGAKPLWREPQEPDFDDTVLHGECFERERYDTERRPSDPEQRIGHEQAQANIAKHVREIQILCDVFGIDPNEFLADSAEACEWSEIEDGSRIYNTCRPGEEFHLTEGLELWPHCHFCGKRIEVVSSEHNGT